VGAEVAVEWLAIGRLTFARILENPLRRSDAGRPCHKDSVAVVCEKWRRCAYFVSRPNEIVRRPTFRCIGCFENGELTVLSRNRRSPRLQHPLSVVGTDPPTTEVADADLDDHEGFVPATPRVA
jgi:hypothetical protein